MTLRYTGLLPAFVTAFDDNERIFMKTVVRDETFVLNAESDDKFKNEVNLFVGLILNVKIKATCSLDFDPSEQHGLFVIVSVLSKNGGKMCCTPSGGGPPNIINCPSSINVSAGTSCSAVVSWTPPQTESTCNLLSLISTHEPGSTFPIGQTKVIYTATDTNNKISTCNFNVTVRDDTGPKTSNCPNAIIVNAIADNCKARATWQPPVFTDACGNNVTVTSTHKPGHEFPIGTTDVTYTARDNGNNITTCTFQVIVKDLVPPVIRNCPADISLTATSAFGNTPVAWKPPVATDECAMTSFLSTHEPGDIFPNGSTVVTYTATDKSGNITTCSFTVKIDQEETPLDIRQLVTPDGNGSNDIWFIGNIEKYPANKVIIVDRWGSLIYTTTGYDNVRKVWNGESMKGGLVPTGTYFYTLSIHAGTAVTERKGFIEVVR